MLKFLSRTIYKHPIIVAFTWLVAVIAIASVALGGVTGSNIFDRLDNSAPTVNGEAQKGDDILDKAEDKTKYSETIFIYIDGLFYYENNKKVKIDFVKLKDELKQDNLELITAYELQKSVVENTPELSKLVKDKSFVSLINVTAETEEELKNTVNNVLEASNNFATEIEADLPSSTVLVGSKTTAEEAVIASVEKDLLRGEIISLPIALLVLIFVFGGFLAAGLPLIGAGISIITSLGTLFALSYAFKMHTSVLNVLTIIGLGLSIDYGLLMLSRFRESLRSSELQYRRQPVREALVNTMNTAGKTVIFSGLTVAIATATLILFEPDIMKSIGVATTTVVILAVITSITLLPAIFVLLNKKLTKPSVLIRVPLLGKMLKGFGDVPPKKGFFSKLVRMVQKHPWLWAVSTTLILVLAGTSVANLQMSTLSSNSIPQSSETGKLFNILDEKFPKLKAPDIQIVFDTNNENIVNDYKVFIEKLDNEDNVVKTKINDNTFTITADSSEIKTTINNIRDFRDYNNHQNIVYITGETARDLDYINSLLSTAPYVAIIIMFMTGLLLFLMTSSALIPLKAIILSALSLSASIGVIVWGFQEGHLSELLNFNPSDIEQIDPLMIILILVLGFGLAMDYEMFLISRIKEKHAHGESNNYAVRAGIQASGRIITSAALMMIVVFLGFAVGENISIKMMGVALSAAIFIDATLVRCLLLPAIMTIVGEKIWWAPVWMKKIHAKIGVEH